MIKKLSLILVAMLIIVGQSLQAQEMKSKSSKKETKEVQVVSTDAQAVTAKTTAVSPDDFDAMAESLVGKEIEITGMVIHVCKHGGKKAFLNTSTEDVNIKITPGEKVAAFPPELEGSTIWVTGIVEMEQVEVEKPAEEKDEMSEKHEDDEEECKFHKKIYSIKATKYKVVG